MKNILITVFALLTISASGQKRVNVNPALDSLMNNPDKVAVSKKLMQLGKGTEKDMVTVLNYHFKDTTKRDSVLKLILQRFPKGAVAYNQAENEVFNEDNADKKEQLLIKLQKDFPDKDLDEAYYRVSYTFAKAKNYAKMHRYMDMMKDVSKKGWAIGYNAQWIDNSDHAAAEALLRSEMERLTAMGTPIDESSKSRYYAFKYFFGDVLLAQGKYDQALPYLNDAYDHMPVKSDRLTGDYGLVKSKTGQHEQAVEPLKKLISNGKATPEMKATFLESYKIVYPDSNATAYIKNAQENLDKKADLAIVKKEIAEPSPAFEIKDENGKLVSLKDFKGKTIVLDFWAVWCGPCKASFPAMQKVVNRYKADSKVKFLFIHTLETKPHPLDDARKYLADNHYSFDLYIDPKDPVTKSSMAVAAFGAKGIPAKFVIDRSGMIRFKLVGFEGTDDDAIKELSAMIEIAKKKA